MRLPFVAAPAWWAGAKCRLEKKPLSHFFAKEEASEARRFCRDCPVRTRCLTDHLEEPFGVWGGHSRDERMHIRSEMDRGANLQDVSRMIDGRRRSG